APPPPPAVYTLSLHDALPICGGDTVEFGGHGAHGHCFEAAAVGEADRRADDADLTQPRRTACPSFVATAALRRRALIRRALSHRSEEHTSELQSRFDLVCRLL